MNYMIYLSAFLYSFSLTGDYVSPLPAGSYDEHLQCTVTHEGLCETEYVDELLELCEECGIEAPENIEVSDFEAWCRSQGIKLFYIIYEQPLKVVGYVGAAGVGCYLLKRALFS